MTCKHAVARGRARDAEDGCHLSAAAPKPREIPLRAALCPLASHRNYTWVCFAHPAVRAITWWDLGDQGSFIPGGGMLREDLSPKPVYEQLKRLIHEEWETRASGTTDGEGRFSFRGFLGTYKVVVAIPGKTIEKQFHLEREKANEMTVSLP